ncbi:MAG: hypothetical protein HC933_15660, partial [Pleurocapsa sp. SU_196_0]|nr:hypothetical protein [Pleurocapsa sp. SU_196_0]
MFVGFKTFGLEEDRSITRSTPMNLKTVIVSAALAVSSFALASSDFLLTVTPGLSAQQYYQEAQRYAAEAQIAYPMAFADLPLWNRAIANAEAAARL